MRQVVLGFAGVLATVVVDDPDVFPIAHLVGDMLPEDIAEQLRVSTRTVQRWIQSGIHWDTADTFATKILSDHPGSVWGQKWEDAAAAACDVGGPEQLDLFA